MSGSALSIVALGVSVSTAVYAAIVSRDVSHHEVRAAVIADFYSSMRALTVLQIQEWRLAHLFEIAENYPRVVDLLCQVAPASMEPAAVELKLKERAVALTLFGLYEHVLYQLDEAIADRDRLRSKFLIDATQYFTDRLLANPRLRYLWSQGGGNLECEFEEPVRMHYRAHVAPAPESWDETGPYGS